MRKSDVVRFISLLLPIVLIIQQIIAFIILPDIVPTHVYYGTVTSSVPKLSITGFTIMFAGPAVTLIVALIVERTSRNHSITDEVATDRGLCSILFTIVIFFVQTCISIAGLNITD